MKPQRQSPEALSRKIDLQRFGMGFERFWSLAHWPLMVLGLAFILVASGALLNLDSQARLAALVALAILFLVSLKSFFNFVMPTRYAAMRRMELEAGLGHRSISSSHEDLAGELQDTTTQDIWAEHKRRTLQGLDNVPISIPRSSWRSFDPKALRVPMVAAAAAAWFLGAGDFSTSLKNTLAFKAPVVVTNQAVDAWLKPPAYTKKPPVLLTSEAMRQKLLTDGELLVPEKSILTLRATGYNTPTLEVLSLGDTDSKVLSEVSVKTTSGENGFAAELTVTRPMTVVLKESGSETQRFSFSVIPDRAPEIKIPKAPEQEGLGSLTVFWDVVDDYGVKAVTSEITLADEQANGIGFEDNGIFLYDPPDFKVKLKKSTPTAETGKTTQDLTAHPWAGFAIELQLSATDAAGNTTLATPIKLSLPERPFSRPLAQALIEQRKELILSPDNSPEIAEMLDLIGAYPKGLTDRTGHLIRIGAIRSSIDNARNYDDLKKAVDELWTLAIDIEDGALKDAKAELKSLKEQLEQAIRDGASKEKIAELSQKLRDAMQKYLKQLQAERDKRKGPDNQQQQADQGQQQNQVTQEDLQKMMDAIEELSKSGAKEQAQALLDELDRILQNLEMGEGQQQAGQGQDPMQDMLDQLGEMMKKQQGLMDETQRMPGGGDPQPGDQGNGEQGQGKGKGKSPGDMAGEQGKLGEMMDRLLKELGKDAPQQLGDARGNMGGAEGDLREGDQPGALDNQGKALQGMREGAGKLGQMMRERQQQRGQGQAGRRGQRDGEGAGQDNDPLGRPRATRNPDLGPDKDIVPGELAIRRAREILESLRSRANEGTLNETERNYIDRLLRGLY